MRRLNPTQHSQSWIWITIGKVGAAGLAEALKSNTTLTELDLA